MNKRGFTIVSAIMALLFAITSGCIAAQEGGDLSNDPSWNKNYDAALAKAKESGRRVLINFTGSDWCHWCILMDEETLSKQAFKDYADKHLVLVYVDSPARKQLESSLVSQNDRLKRKYGVSGFPTFVVLDPDGKEIDRREGYVQGGPDNFIYFLKVTEGAEKLAK